MSNLTIQEALAKIREVIPAAERSVFIGLEVKTYDHLPNQLPEVEWRVWDERDSYFAPSLEMAVQKCLLANTTVDTALALINAESVVLQMGRASNE